MFDIGWVEMAMIAIVALIVIGPRDLPKAMRTVSQWIGKARSLAREFQSGLDDIVHETELQEFKDEIEQAADFDFVDNAIEGDLDYPTAGHTDDYVAGIEAAEKKKKAKPAAKKTAAKSRPNTASKTASKAASKSAPKAPAGKKGGGARSGKAAAGAAKSRGAAAKAPRQRAAGSGAAGKKAGEKAGA